MSLNTPHLDPHMDNNSPIARLNAVRTLIVVVIAFGYASTMSIGPGNPESAKIFSVEPSWLGIQALFFFSGALAYRSYLGGRRGWTYLSSRIRRVFPILLAMTLTTITVIYPLLGKPLDGAGDYLALAEYAFLTLTVLDPGRPLPGLLDNALYMCLIQGAIWTLRWGFILHIAMTCASKFKVLMAPRLLLIASILSTLLYAALHYISAVSPDTLSGSPILSTALSTALIGLRFGYVFLLGMTLWAYRASLPRRGIARAGLAAALFGTAALNFIILPWTPFIEITLTLGAAYLAWLAATSVTSKLSFLSGWPSLAAGLFMINWPTAQVLLHVYPDFGRWSLPTVSLPLSMGLTLLTYWALSGQINKLIARAALRRKVPVKAPRL